MTRTKTIATLGPATADIETIERMIRLGVNVFRLNFSHGAHAFHNDCIAMVRKMAGEIGRPVAILQDISGPKIRVGPVEPIMLQKGDTLSIWIEQPPSGVPDGITINYPNLLGGLFEGDHVFFADGTIRSRVLDICPDKVTVEILTGGKLIAGKGVNLPIIRSDMSSITEKDENDIRFGVEHDVDLIALSFVQSSDDICRARKLVEEAGGDIPVFAKIEKGAALDNIEEIIAAADGLMIARGDLGVEMGPYVIPVLQKQIIDKASEKGLPVIIATQMLMSMISSPYPTRAEVSDIANAVLDGADAVMLSDETTVGEFPEEAIRVVGDTVRETEAFYPWFRKFLEVRGTRKAIAASAIALSRRTDVEAVVVFTETGLTAMMVARQRPEIRIIAVTSKERTYRRLSVVWGVEPYIVERKYENNDKAIFNFYHSAVRDGTIDPDERFIVTISSHSTRSGSTNVVQLIDEQSLSELKALG